MFEIYISQKFHIQIFILYKLYMDLLEWIANSIIYTTVCIVTACFRLEVQGKKIAGSLVSKSWTAYTLEECLHFCAREFTFQCQGFSYRLENIFKNNVIIWLLSYLTYRLICINDINRFLFISRRLIDQADALNCDLTETNTTNLNEYNPRHFSPSSITDVYQLYYKNDGSFYCDNLSDAINKNLVMYVREGNDVRKQITHNETKTDLLKRNHTYHKRGIMITLQ